MKAISTLILATCVLAAAVGRPQKPERASRGVAQEHEPASGRISGHVVDAQTGRPLGGAQVLLLAADPRVTRQATTAMDGSYLFTGVLPATYSVRASRPAFIDTEYGEDLVAGREPQTVTLAEGDEIEDVDIRLIKGGVIAGRVTDVFGDSVAGVQVQLAVVLDAERESGVVRPLGLPPRTSDDLGRYRLFGIPPGDYYVVAGLERHVAPQGGRATLDSPDKEASLSFQYQASSDPVLAAAEATADYRQTFYPDVLSVFSAALVPVHAGEEVSGIDIRLVPGPLMQPAVVAHLARSRSTVDRTCMPTRLGSFILPRACASLR